jgi:hypothetical protein
VGKRLFLETKRDEGDIVFQSSQSEDKLPVLARFADVKKINPLDFFRVPQYSPKPLDPLARAQAGGDYYSGVCRGYIKPLIQCLAANEQPERPVFVTV